MTLPPGRTKNTWEEKEEKKAGVPGMPGNTRGLSTWESETGGCLRDAMNGLKRLY